MKGADVYVCRKVDELCPHLVDALFEVSISTSVPIFGRDYQLEAFLFC